MELNVINASGEVSSVIEVSDDVFNKAYNADLVHQLVVAFLANARSGTRQQKNRKAISRSTKKPWKQKGTGRARAGTASSPIWRGGARAFPSSPEENFSHKVNRKMYRAGIAVILSKLIADGRMVLTDNIDIQSHKTQEAIRLFENMHLAYNKLLLVVEYVSEDLYLATRNLSTLLLETAEIDPYHLVRCDKVLLTVAAIREIEERFLC